MIRKDPVVPGCQLITQLTAAVSGAVIYQNQFKILVTLILHRLHARNKIILCIIHRYQHAECRSHFHSSLHLRQLQPATKGLIPLFRLKGCNTACRIEGHFAKIDLTVTDIKICPNKRKLLTKFLCTFQHLLQ